MNRTGTTIVFDLSWLAERIKKKRAVKSKSSALLDFQGAINNNCFDYTWRFLCAYRQIRNIKTLEIIYCRVICKNQTLYIIVLFEAN